MLRCLTVGLTRKIVLLEQWVYYILVLICKCKSAYCYESEAYLRMGVCASAGRAIRHRACALKDTAHALIDTELDEEFEKQCKDIVESRRSRGWLYQVVSSSLCGILTRYQQLREYNFQFTDICHPIVIVTWLLNNCYRHVVSLHSLCCSQRVCTS